MDEIDGRLIDLFAIEPRIGVLEASRRLGVARGTVQARLDKLVAARASSPAGGPELSPEALGFPVMAFLTLEIRQGAADEGGHEAVAAHLATIPEVLEAYTITGDGDMWARVVARSNADLQRVIDLVLADPGIDRSTDRHRPRHPDPAPGAAAGQGSHRNNAGDGGPSGPLQVPAMPTQPGPDDVVNALTDLLNRRYVFPDLAAQAADAAASRPGRRRLRGPRGTDPDGTADHDLYDVCADHHLRLIWHEEPQALIEGLADDDPVQLAEWRAEEEVDGPASSASSATAASA